ncbi:trypsin-like peptidase domain-containing protein [Roseisolibacter sp. H3M3-2]|uniref:S1C family serine protease n=1 Tax=Roseisolibacter sp. H3M3-2 TaxID=3031323 RepID=UPI0023DA1A65|nr:trypsin-like peptidase domain-containing protein [Roseisolibacter sp. H3M3-2]MDF1506054.1 trypsin-like peptidase domain-containing protein [Roseisolibacter sp. H3M3-2]
MTALDDELDRIATALCQSTAIVRSAGRRNAANGPEGQGAAVVWSADGLLVTNPHVARADRTLVDLADGRRLAARTVARDPAHDLAVLRVDPGPAPLVPAPVGDPAALRPGGMVLAFGHPLGISNALAMGVYHGTRAPLLRHLGADGKQRLLCADIRLAPGNSGGPLADAAGRVIGINTLIAGGLGYAVPIDRARALADALNPRLRLGVTVRTVRVRPRDGEESPALLVLEVAPGLPAESAGVLPGDVLFSLDGRALREPGDLAAALATVPAGRAPRLAIGRAGRQRTLTLPATIFTHHTRWAA